MDNGEELEPGTNTVGTTNLVPPDSTFNDPADIADAVRGAQLLLSYATERGLDLPPDVVKIIVESKHLLRKGAGWEAANEVDLWTALNSVAKAVKPVSVVSLKYMSDASPDRAGVSAANGASGRIATSQKAVRRYRNLFIACLAVLLIVQMYWLVGSTITSDYEATLKKIGELTSERDKLKFVTTVSKESTTPPPREIVNFNDEIEHKTWIAGTRIESLQKWNKIWSLFTLFGKDVTYEDPYIANPKVLLTAGIVLTAMQVYLLPLLYGLVGACAYILRNLASAIEDQTFSGASEIRYRLRFYLGALAGMAVGWFLTPESSPTLLKQISPFALAFLAGYSVEVLFSAMDRFIAAFASEKAAGIPAAK